ncbi:MAG: glycosyltransferase [Armatimonadota bacterium]|nr:glycosyltransferase [Armatimonadota bacterium]
MLAQWVLPVLGVQALVLLANWRHWRRRRVGQGAGDTLHTTVSVLIPLRNERVRLPQLVETLRRLHPAPAEVILCDDESSDGSREWLGEHLPQHGGGDPLSWFPAPPKPHDWVGKNWACYQLAQRAQGQWLLFLDADLDLHEKSIYSITCAIRNLATEPDCMVTAIPALRARNLPIGLLKAMVPFSVFTLLPLHFAETHPHPSFAFANGQVIAFPREYYLRIQPHERVRGAVLEDVQLARVVKADGGRVWILDARGVITVSMYSTFAEAVDGFSKNGVAICGSLRAAVAIAMALFAIYLLPLVEAVWRGWDMWHSTHYAMGALLFALSGWMAGLPLWYGVLFPLSVLVGEGVLWRSIVWYRRGEVRWKGRPYRVC